MATKSKRKYKKEPLHLTDRPCIKGYIIDLEPIIQHFIFLANQPDCCKHFFESVISLLQAHKLFYQYYSELNVKVRKLQYEKDSLLRFTSIFAPCNGCGLLCDNCQKEGTLWCAKCVCIRCKRSQNITQMAPMFNKHCWECATEIWPRFEYYRYQTMPNKIEKINAAKHLNYMWLSVIQSIISVTTNNITSCRCDGEATLALLLTCKAFSEYLPLNMIPCNYCRKTIIGGRKCDICYICKDCKLGISPGLSCGNCMKLGVLKCEKCTCAHCGNSANVTGASPIFGTRNLQLCWKCAKRKYGDSFGKTKRDNMWNRLELSGDMMLINSYAFHILPMIDIIGYSLEYRPVIGVQITNTPMIHQSSTKSNYHKQNVKRNVKQNVKQNLKHNKNSNKNIRCTGQIQQRNSRK
jgi:hypothetical protein